MYFKPEQIVPENISALRDSSIKCHFEKNTKKRILTLQYRGLKVFECTFGISALIFWLFVALSEFSKCQWSYKCII